MEGENDIETDMYKPSSIHVIRRRYYLQPYNDVLYKEEKKRKQKLRQSDKG